MTLTPLSNIQLVAIAQVRLDGGTQSRIALNEEYINELAQAVSEGEILPPVIIYSDASEYWLADGFHRYHALKRSEQETIASDVRQGTRRDAVLYAVGANARHGLRRTNADKRRSVETLLHDPEWAQWSNREVARQCGVSLNLVNGLRRELSELEVQIAPPHERLIQRNGTIYTMNSSRIGRFQLQKQMPITQEGPDLDSHFPHSSEYQERGKLLLEAWERPSLLSLQDPTRASLMPQQTTYVESEDALLFERNSEKEDKEGEEVAEDDFLSTSNRSFTSYDTNTLRDEVLSQEKERRDTHVLRILGSSESPEWYTPQEIVRLTCELLGEIDLDPCSNSHHAPVVPARVLYTKAEDGLALPWKGKTYLNPPYGSEIPQWVQKLVQSHEAGEVDEAIALLPGRIDTIWFQPLYAYPICHIRGRLQFANSPYHAPFPCVIVYLGTRSDAFIEIFKCKGPILRRVG